jgi:hypothetical protein
MLQMEAPAICHLSKSDKYPIFRFFHTECTTDCKQTEDESSVLQTEVFSM